MREGPEIALTFPFFNLPCGAVGNEQSFSLSISPARAPHEERMGSEGWGDGGGSAEKMECLFDTEEGLQNSAELKCQKQPLKKNWVIRILTLTRLHYIQYVWLLIPSNCYPVDEDILCFSLSSLVNLFDFRLLLLLPLFAFIPFIQQICTVMYYVFKPCVLVCS